MDECVFKIGGEGGSISIYRILNGNSPVFRYHHHEFDPLGELDDLQINEEITFSSFEEAFEKIDVKPYWPFLYPVSIHDDYKDYVAGRFHEKLKTESSRKIDPHSKAEWEILLGRELK